MIRIGNNDIVTSAEFAQNLERLKQYKYQEGYANGVANERERILKAIDETIVSVEWMQTPQSMMLVAALRDVCSKIEG